MPDDLRERVVSLLSHPVITSMEIDAWLALIRAERAAARETPEGDWQALSVGENEYVYGHASVIAKVTELLRRLTVAESLIYRARAEEERRG